MFNLKPNTDMDLVTNQRLIDKLIADMKEESRYLLTLQRKKLDTVYDPLHTWVIEEEIVQTEENLFKKGEVLKTIFKIARFDRSVSEKFGK